MAVLAALLPGLGSLLAILGEIARAAAMRLAALAMAAFAMTAVTVLAALLPGLGRLLAILGEVPEPPRSLLCIGGLLCVAGWINCGRSSTPSRASSDVVVDVMGGLRRRGPPAPHRGISNQRSTIIGV